MPDTLQRLGLEVKEERPSLGLGGLLLTGNSWFTQKPRKQLFAFSPFSVWKQDISSSHLEKSLAFNFQAKSSKNRLLGKNADMNCFWRDQEWVVEKIVPDIVDKRPLKKCRKGIMRAIFLFSYFWEKWLLRRIWRHKTRSWTLAFQLLAVT